MTSPVTGNVTCRVPCIISLSHVYMIFSISSMSRYLNHICQPPGKDVCWITELGHGFIQYERRDCLVPVRFRRVTFRAPRCENLSRVEMRLERVKNHKPGAIDARRCHRCRVTNESPGICFHAFLVSSCMNAKTSLSL